MEISYILKKRIVFNGTTINKDTILSNEQLFLLKDVLKYYLKIGFIELSIE